MLFLLQLSLLSYALNACFSFLATNFVTLLLVSIYIVICLIL